MYYIIYSFKYKKFYAITMIVIKFNINYDNSQILMTRYRNPFLFLLKIKIIEIRQFFENI